MPKDSLALMRKIFFLIYFFSLSWLHALSLEEKYPHYTTLLTELEIDEDFFYDENFRHFILRYEKKLSYFYHASLSRGTKILPTLQEILLNQNMSQRFIYLSMIESGFSTHALSSKKAVGLWQFMPSTARQYGLTISSSYDERYNITLSTYSAIKYLNKLHKQFGKWYLAIMAYNCGEGRLSKAITKAKSNKLSVLISSTAKYLPKETRQYIQKILLVAMIGEAQKQEQSPIYKDDSHIQTVEVASGTKLKNLARLLEIPLKELSKLNPSIKNNALGNTKPLYTISIPSEKVFAFYLSYELTLNPKENSFMLTHLVKLGESLKSIAKIYKLKVEEIKNSNFLENDFLVLDSELMLFVSEEIFEKFKSK